MYNTLNVFAGDPSIPISHDHLGYAHNLKPPNSSGAGQLKIGSNPGSPFAIASLYAFLSPTLFKYPKIFGCLDRSNGMNFRIVVRENTLMISAAVKPSPANHVTCSSRDSSRPKTFSTGIRVSHCRVVSMYLCSSQYHDPRHNRLEVRIREVEPVEVVRIIRMGGWKG